MLYSNTIRDWVQTTAAVYAGAGWMWYEGAGNQMLSSTADITVPRLRVGNASRLILGSDVAVNNSVDLTNNGNIELGVFNLVANTGATFSNYDATNYIITNGTGGVQHFLKSR